MRKRRQLLRSLRDRNLATLLSTAAGCMVVRWARDRDFEESRCGGTWGGGSAASSTQESLYPLAEGGAHGTILSARRLRRLDGGRRSKERFRELSRFSHPEPVDRPRPRFRRDC